MLWGEVRKGKKRNHSSHRQIEMCQEWDHLFQLRVPLCEAGREMRALPERCVEQLARHAPLRTSFLPLRPWPWLMHTLGAALHRQRAKGESDAKWASALLSWPGAFTWRLQSTPHQETKRDSGGWLSCKQLQQKLQRGLANLFAWEEMVTSQQTLCFSCNIPHGIKGQLDNWNYCHKVAATFATESQFSGGVGKGCV